MNSYELNKIMWTLLDYYNKVISKNVTYYEYIQKLVSLNEKPSEIAKQMISLGIKDKKCTELFLEYVAHD